MSLLSKFKGSKKTKSTSSKPGPKTRSATEQPVSRLPAAGAAIPGEPIAETPEIDEPKKRIAEEREAGGLFADATEPIGEASEAGELVAGAKKRVDRAKKKGAKAGKKSTDPQKKQALMALAHAIFQMSTTEQKIYAGKEEQSTDWRDSRKEYVRMARKMIRRLEKRGIQFSGPEPKAGAVTDEDIV